VQNLTPFQREEVRVTALEIMQEVVIEALDHADRYDPSRQPMAWFLGIALNIIKRKKKKLVEGQRHELRFSQLAMSYPEPISQDELLDSLTSSTQRGPEQVVEDEEQVRALLSLVSADDQRILSLAFLEDCERDILAQRLGTTPAAARVRLHRALRRLRAAWYEQLEGESNA
jgi:RNA polymerase sigma factor (sigma-70 family)